MKMKFIVLLGGKPLAKLSKEGKIEVLQTDDEEVIKRVCECMVELFEDVGYAKVTEGPIDKACLTELEKMHEYAQYKVSLPSKGKTIFKMSKDDIRKAEE